jgi:hypothetical protein
MVDYLDALKLFHLKIKFNECQSSMTGSKKQHILMGIKKKNFE